MFVFLLLTVAMVLVLLIAEYREYQRGKWISKPLASLGFVGVVWAAGAWESDYGRLVLLALVLSWAGDVLLIPVDNARAFRAGLFTFLSGHLVFCTAFVVRGTDITFGVTAGALLAAAAVPVWHWLRPGLAPEMRSPVYAYVFVISLMVALSAATYGYRASPLIPLGAVLFYLSDISVARDRFVSAGFVNRLWGLPAYYAAQLALAWSVGGQSAGS
jgi:uncharacterized membrane protein YhhN